MSPSNIFILKLYFQAAFKNNFVGKLFMGLEIFIIYTHFLLYHTYLLAHIPKDKQLYKTKYLSFKWKYHSK